MVLFHTKFHVQSNVPITCVVSTAAICSFDIIHSFDVNFATKLNKSCGTQDQFSSYDQMTLTCAHRRSCRTQMVQESQRLVRGKVKLFIYLCSILTYHDILVTMQLSYLSFLFLKEPYPLWSWDLYFFVFKFERFV